MRPEHREWLETVCRRLGAGNEPEGGRLSREEILRLMDLLQDDSQEDHDGAGLSRRRYMEVFEGSRDGIVIADARGRFLDANRSFCELIGYTPEELRRLDSLYSVTPEKYHEWERREIWEGKLALGRDPGLYEKEYIRRDGTRIPVEIRAHAETEHTGETKYIWKMVRDISARRQRDERLGLFAQMVDEASVSITVHNALGRFLYANRYCIEAHGYETMEEFLELPLRALDVPESADRIAKRMEQIKVSGQARFEVVHYRKDRSTFPLEVSAKVIRWQGEPAFLSIGVDMSERLEAERRLAESEDKYRAIFNQSVEGIYVHDFDGVIIDANETAVRQSGFSIEELIGMSIFDRHASSDGSINLPKEEIKAMWRQWEGEAPHLIEADHLHRDGSAYPVQVSVGTVSFGGENRVLAITRDLTEERRAAQERQNLYEQLIQAQKMESIGRLAGGVAHDFNNMLSIIMGHTELALMDLPPDDARREDLLEIEQAARRSVELTKQLLAFARRQTIAPKVLDANETVSGMLKMLARLIGENIQLVWQPGTSLPSMLMDPMQISQVLVNLCVNARDAIGTGPGRVTIETVSRHVDEAYCHLHPGFHPGEYIVLSVSDDGCGMDEEIRLKIFEPFFTTKPVGEGTGLGLSTVYGIVRQNSGFIHVYSEPGHGTTFSIYLPIHLAKEEQATLPDEQEAQSGLAGGETILLVEDEPIILKMVKSMLVRIGYKVLDAATPGEALEIARTHPGAIELLITDVVMPEMNGRDLAKRLLTLQPSMRRLFMSGYTANVIAHHGVLDEGVNFLQKPFSRGLLAQKIREVMDRP